MEARLDGIAVGCYSLANPGIHYGPVRSGHYMSGHSKWAQIKRKKAVTDRNRSKLFTRLIREIQIAAREGSGDAVYSNANIDEATLAL
jgi:hypothetical protein